MCEAVSLSEGVLKDTPSDIPFRVRNPLGQSTIKIVGGYRLGQ